jgi:hypothetical protein
LGRLTCIVGRAPQQQGKLGVCRIERCLSRAHVLWPTLLQSDELELGLRHLRLGGRDILGLGAALNLSQLGAGR